MEGKEVINANALFRAEMVWPIERWYVQRVCDELIKSSPLPRFKTRDFHQQNSDQWLCPSFPQASNFHSDSLTVYSGTPNEVILHNSRVMNSRLEELHTEHAEECHDEGA